MIEIVRKIVSNVLISLYEPFTFAVIMTVLCMFFYMLAQERGWKKLVYQWVDTFKKDKEFRKLFIFVFYVIMILFKTLLNRDVWANPLSDVIGIWGLHNMDGELTTEVLENLALFIPFSIMLLWCFGNKMVDKKGKFMMTVWQSAKSVFLFSFIIEFLQLFMRLGTFQLSDLFYNTLGGFIGGLIYWCGYKITHRKKKEKDITDTP